jgi:hypothetical protein
LPELPNAESKDTSGIIRYLNMTQISDFSDGFVRRFEKAFAHTDNAKAVAMDNGDLMPYLKNENWKFRKYHSPVYWPAWFN